jgi:hypothetical protein
VNNRLLLPRTLSLNPCVVVAERRGVRQVCMIGLVLAEIDLDGVRSIYLGSEDDGSEHILLLLA